MLYAGQVSCIIKLKLNLKYLSKTDTQTLFALGSTNFFFLSKICNA